jgi:hypothetical protein
MIAKASKSSNPLGLQLGFEWTQEAFALLGLWRHKKKKGAAFCAETGEFPGMTAETLRVLWDTRWLEIKAAYEEIYGHW